MKLALTVNGLPEQIEILAPAPACRFRLADGEIQEALVETPEPGIYSILLNGRRYEARIAGAIITVNGHAFEIEVRDPREWSAKSGARAGDGVQTIAALMPGKIVRLLVTPGDDVQAGQGLVVVEAMKMQNEMRASRAGRVLTVAAREGATVMAGEVLATIA